MKPDYSTVVFEDLKNGLKDKNLEVDFVIFRDEYDAENFRNQYKQGVISDVIGLDVRGFEYIKDRIVSTYIISDSENYHMEYEYDYINTMPVELLFSIFMYTKNISLLSVFEEAVQLLYSTTHKLSIGHPLLEDRQICFDFSIREGVDIIRRGGQIKQENISEGRPTYYSGIRMIGYNCVFCKENYSAAQLDLDKNAKPLLIERLAALEDIKNIMIEQDEAGNHEKIAAIDSAWNELDAKINGTQGITTYHNLYQFMTDNKCDCKEALQKIREAQEKKAKNEKIQQQKKEEKIRYADKMYTKKGDEVINKYTDLIVAYIQNNLSVGYSVYVYGGSTECELQRKDHIGELEFPVVMVRDGMRYSYEIKDYENINSAGEIVLHNYTQFILPINYWVVIRILAKEAEQKNEIAKCIESLLEKADDLKLPDPVIQGEYYQIKLNIKNSSDDIILKTDYYMHTIEIEKIACAYHVKDYNKEDIIDNQVLQLRLTQQTQFIFGAWLFGGKAIKKFNKIFPKLTKKGTSIAASILQSVIYSKEYTELKECMDNDRPIDRDLFEKVFSDVVKFYPNLFDKFMQGWSYEQIKDDILKYREYFSQRLDFLLDLLGIPKDMYCNKWLHQVEALEFYINKMSNNRKCTLFDAIEEYKKKVEADYAELQRQRQAEMEEREAQGSSGGGFFSDVIKTAGGVALGNKMSGVGRRRDGKKDLLGTSVCQRGKRSGHGYHTYSSCIGCSVRSECTRG